MTNVKEIGTYSAQNRVENQSICNSLFPDLFQIKNNLGSAQPLLRKKSGREAHGKKAFVLSTRNQMCLQ